MDQFRWGTPPGTYRPPYYRPLPPNYRPGDAWRPQPELYRSAKIRVEAKREINRNININRDINVGTGRQPRVGDRPATLEKALRDRGRDLPGVPRAQVPKRPTTLNEVRPGIGDKARPAVRPAAGSTVFRDAGGGIDARKARDRGEISVDRSKRPQAPQAKVPSAAPVRAPEVNRKLVQQRPQASQGSGSSRAPALRVQPGGRPQVTSERGRASLQRKR